MSGSSPSGRLSTWPSRGRSGALATGLFAALLAVSVAGCGGGSDEEHTTAVAPKAPTQLPPGRKPVVVDVGPIVQESPYAPYFLDQLVDIGVDTVRVGVFWQAVTPPESPPPAFDPGDPADPSYDFAVPDGFIREAKARGLKVLLTVSGPPQPWGTVDGKADSAPDPAAFGAFVRAVATRYGGGYDPDGKGGKGKLPGVDMWSVWNEPNLFLFLTPQLRDGKPYSPILYRMLYLAAQGAIEAADPGAPILIGETAPTGSRDSVDPIPFARSVLCLDPATQSGPACASGQIHAVGWAVHPYGSTGDAPYAPADSKDFVTTSSLAGLESVLDRAAAAGTVRPNLPLYFTEYGVQSKPDPLAGVPLDTQAEYLAISEQIAYYDPRVRGYGQYLYIDDPPDRVPGQSYGGFESGLRFADGSPKPSFEGFRLPLVVRRSGNRVEIWGLVRPSRKPTEVEVRVQDGGVQKTLQTVPTNDAGIFQLRSGYRQGRLWQVRWTDPSGHTFEGPWTRSYAFPYPASDTAAPRISSPAASKPSP